MRKALKRIAEVGAIIWFFCGWIVGAQISYHQGYTRGVRDIGTMVLELHDAGGGDLPEEADKRDIRWRRP